MTNPREARAIPLRAFTLRWATVALFVVLDVVWLRYLAPLVGNDAAVYRAGAAGLFGGDPWAQTVNGYSYAAPPLEAVPWLILVPLPDVAARLAGVAIALTGAIVIVRRLGLSREWILYPPLVVGVVLGNPAIAAMGAVLLGVPLVGAILRPQLLPVAGWQTWVAFGALSLAALTLRPDFLTGLAADAERYASEGYAVNAWGSWLVVPVLAGLLLLWRVDPRAAAWLLMPAVGPAMGWYGYAMVMPVSVPLAIVCAIPIPGLGAVAIAGYGVIRWTRTSGRWASPSDGRRNVQDGAILDRVGATGG